MSRILLIAMLIFPVFAFSVDTSFAGPASDQLLLPSNPI